jgi:ABC-type nickel/cobalt efflux system permease component RcnA
MPAPPSLLLSLPSFSLLTAFVLGALHALEPGHGKIVIATYMGQPTATYADVLKLGGIIIFAHGLVLWLGVALFFNLLHHTQGIPAIWFNLLQLVSATFVVILGLNMLRRTQHLMTPPQQNATSQADLLDSLEALKPCSTSCQHSENDVAQASILKATSVWQRNKELFLLGLMSGLRPCPLTLSSLSLAISLGQWKAFAFVVVFSIGMSCMLQQAQGWFLKIAGALVLVMGLYFVWYSFQSFK